MVNRQLAPPSRQCSSTFLALDSDFFGEKLDSCDSSGSLRLLTFQVCLLFSFFSARRSDTFLTMKIQQEHETIPQSNAAFHQLTLLTVGKNSRMHMKVQGRVMQARFIEIRQIFAEKNKVGYFSNRPRMC
jgi:hypothetical protein